MVLSRLDSVALRSKIDSTFKAKEQLADKKAGKKKRKQSNRVEIVSNTNNVFSSGDENLVEETTDWYFGNPSAMALGQTEFRRIWGEITLEDNWRRSLRSSSTSTVSRNTTGRRNSETGTAKWIRSSQRPIPSRQNLCASTAKFQEPKNKRQRRSRKSKMPISIWEISIISSCLKMTMPLPPITNCLRRFPETAYEPEVLYKLYLIYKDNDPAQSDSFATQLKTKYPNSTFAKILINPDFLKESSQVTEKQKELYKTAYAHFVGGEYRSRNEGAAGSIGTG